jgi:phosphate transport system protein
MVRPKRPSRRQPPRKRNLLHSSSELTRLIEQACLIAIDASFNIADLLANSSKMGLLAVKNCEKELDHLERRIDEDLPDAITQVDEVEARELLACLKFITDLERIGDLMWWIAQRLQQLAVHLKGHDRDLLAKMASTLHGMLKQIHEGLTKRDVGSAQHVLRADSEMDQLRFSIFRGHLQKPADREIHQSIDVLMIAQAFERAGDHCTNLAEEVFHLVQGHSVRHLPKKERESEFRKAGLQI